MSAANDDIRTRLAQVDASIANCRMRLQELEAIRNPLQAQLDRIVYSVLTLPHEITSEIFCQCLPPTPPVPSAEYKDGPSSSQAPLLLLRICRAWSSIAISTPRLCQVHLHLNLDVTIASGDLQERIVEWFRRAASCPLSFSVRGASLATFEEEAIGGILRSYALQLKNLALRLDWYPFHLHDKVGPFPLLEKLAVQLSEPPEEDSHKFDFFGATPRLTELYLTSLASPSMFSLRCTALSTFTCERLSIDELLDVLELAPFLTDLTCSVLWHPIPRTSHTAVIIHRRLQTLRLVDNSSVQFLPLIRLPALQNLHLNIVEDHADNTFFPVFLAHASTSLRKFTIAVKLETVPMGWFFVLSGLVEIELWYLDESFSSDFLSRLDRTKDAGFLPHIRSLSFMNCPLFPLGTLVQALASRCEARDEMAKLQTFRGVWPPNYHSFMILERPVIEILRGFVAGGMEIHIGLKDRNQI